MDIQGTTGVMLDTKFEKPQQDAGVFYCLKFGVEFILIDLIF